MNLTRQKQAADDPRFQTWHKLVVAEAGFSMLDIYGRHKHGLHIEIIKEFADTVNRRDEAGSLHPKAPISALPRRYFREIDESDIPNHITKFRRDFSDFIAANRQTIKAKQVLIDLHVSPRPVAAEYLSVIEEILKEQKDEAGIDEVVIFE
jgi:hypothetical protein